VNKDNHIDKNHTKVADNLNDLVLQHSNQTNYLQKIEDIVDLLEIVVKLSEDKYSNEV
jgi:hypothetical protein